MFYLCRLNGCLCWITLSTNIPGPWGNVTMTRSKRRRRETKTGFLQKVVPMRIFRDLYWNQDCWNPFITTLPASMYWKQIHVWLIPKFIPAHSNWIVHFDNIGHFSFAEQLQSLNLSIITYWCMHQGGQHLGKYRYGITRMAGTVFPFKK